MHLLRSVLSVAFTRGIGGIAQAAVLFALIRSLSAEDFGTFTLVATIAGFVSVITGLGLSTLALRVGGLPEPIAWASQIIKLRDLTMWASAIAVTAVFALTTDNDISLITVASLSVIFEVTSGHLESTLFGLRRVKEAQRSLVSRRAVVLIVLVILLLIETPIAPAYSLGLISGILVGHIWRREIRGDQVTFRNVYQHSKSYWAPSITTRLATLDIVIASSVLAPIQFGTFSAANRAVQTLQIFPSALLSIYTPHLTKVEESSLRHQVAGRMIRHVAILSGGVALLSPAIAGLFSKFIGPGYDQIFWVGTIFVVAFGADCLMQAFTAYFYAAAIPRMVTQSTIWSIAIGLPALAILGASMGVLGAAIAALLMKLVNLAKLIYHFAQDRPKPAS